MNGLRQSMKAVVQDDNLQGHLRQPLICHPCMLAIEMPTTLVAKHHYAKISQLANVDCGRVRQAAIQLNLEPKNIKFGVKKHYVTKRSAAHTISQAI